MKYDKHFWLDQASRFKGELINETTRLISFRSVFEPASKPGDYPYGKANADCLDYMLEKARNDGFIIRNFDHHVGVVQYGRASESVGIACHLDVVDADPSEWKHDPFIARVEDGVIYGRGSNDSKGPTMAAYLALKIIANHNVELTRSVQLILGCNEESGMKCMDHYLDHVEHIPETGFVADCTFPVNFGEHGCAVFEISLPKPESMKAFASYLHKHIISGMATATLYSIDPSLISEYELYLNYFGLTGDINTDTGILMLTGRSAHGSRPNESVNATKHLINFIACHFRDDSLKKLISLLFREDGYGLNIAKQSYRFGSLSISVTGAKTDNDLLRIFLDCRYPSDVNILEIHQKMEDIIHAVSRDISVVLSENSLGFFVDPQSDQVRILKEIYRDFYPEDNAYGKVSSGDTYARKFNGKLLGFGPTTTMHLSKKHIGQAHQPNEGMEIDTLIKAIAIYCETIYRLAR
jgi:succinyl-diaminopimelate desuccinylase